MNPKVDLLTLTSAVETKENNNTKKPTKLEGKYEYKCFVIENNQKLFNKKRKHSIIHV